MPWRRLVGERRYSPHSFLTLAVGEWSVSHPGHALTPGKGPIVQETECFPELVWTQMLEEKSFRLCWGSNLDRLVVQPVARHCTDWATWLEFKQWVPSVFPLLELTFWNPMQDGSRLFLNSERSWHPERNCFIFGPQQWIQVLSPIMIPERKFLSFVTSSDCSWQADAAASDHLWATKAQTPWRSAACSSPPLQFAGMFHMRGLTYQLSLKWYMLFVDSFAIFSHVFICAACGGMTWTLTIFNRSFPMSDWRKPLKSLCTSLGLFPKAVLNVSYILIEFSWV
jgi:hypothetical protein